jgi:hypothetical protein
MEDQWQASSVSAGGLSDETGECGHGCARLGPLSDHTANCRRVLSSERAPYVKEKPLSNIRTEPEGMADNTDWQLQFS